MLLFISANNHYNSNKNVINYYLFYLQQELLYFCPMRDSENELSGFYNNIKQNRPLIMGILNVTPDSFSDGGKYFSVDSAVAKAIDMSGTGADIIDIGGESTRPGAEAVQVDEELKRVIPVIEKILDYKPETIISVDTTKAEVAKEALKRGAAIINDISGLTVEPKIINVVAEFDASVVIMHMKGNPRTMQENPEYGNATDEIFEYLMSSAKKAENAGIKKIIIDPGIGFGKKVQHNYELLKNLNKFTGSGYPLLIGLSRKSFLGKALGLPTGERDNATVIAETISLINGADIIRTHNVKNAVEMKKIFNLIQNPDSVINV